MLFDAHMHCNYSGDSESPASSMIEAAIKMGLSGICFTDHHDIDYPKPPEEPDFLIDFPSYFQELYALKEYYRDDLKIFTGMEIGLQPQIADKNLTVTTGHPFDFIIGSVHVVNGVDPYYGAYFADRTKKEAYEEYFAATIDNVKAFSDFDVLGHLDYMIRYNPIEEKGYNYSDYSDYIDETLKILIETGRGIEVNTSGLRIGLGQTHPQAEILKRYHELGGEILTIGSDSHKPDQVAYGFKQIPDYLKDCGFRFYTVFEKRQAAFIKL